MHLDPALAAFMTSPVMIIIGSRDVSLQPAIGRGLGARIENEAIEVVFSAWQWPATQANLRANGNAAITFSRPADYVTYQLKGRAVIRACVQSDLKCCERYSKDVTGVLRSLGLTPQLIAPLLSDRDLVVARMQVAEVYVQTPGPRAGEPLPAVR
jgi:hypothetical protein